MMGNFLRQYICIDNIACQRYSVADEKATRLLQLQIRVSPDEKVAIRRAAKYASMGMSKWILTHIFPTGAQRFHQLLAQLKCDKNKCYSLSELHDLFHTEAPKEFEQMVENPPGVLLLPYWENYVAAMIEYTANQKGTSPAAWVRKIKPLSRSAFGTHLMSLRLYLLTHSPPPFRYRNIFIDSTVGQRV